ncbi:hypothetical protein [Amycolatopsis sp. CA-230715]|uniref:hypothetical protein n=1 Tax=Amycolatopsis sp. CA-230715 TaxID=2745196 RepID=UPI001C01A306|nr:hypothetical protein [Amycolatopsis sp. CA-230715]QWF83927.1 hypothetical protein HUW46_07370 [Amycolatopsis sp. CA-230715]
MHDLDRAMFETGETAHEGAVATESREHQEFLEVLGEFAGHDSEAESGEAEHEYASELLEVQDEAELDRFLGGLMRRAARGVSGFAKSSTGKALGGILKKAAGQALPVVGRAIGAKINPRYAGHGARAGKALGTLFGLELEGLSNEDAEFETARAFVRFADAAAKLASQAPEGTPPEAAATAAAISAARRHAPGLDIRALLRSAGRRFRGQRGRQPHGSRPRGGSDGGYAPMNTLGEQEWEAGYEYSGEAEGEAFLDEILSGESGEYEGESPFSAEQENQLAEELLEVTNEEELEEFLGKVFRGAAKAARGFIKSPVGKALGGALKGVAKRALPIAGGALGNFVLPGIGGAIGSKLGSFAAGLFELELEGLDEQEAEFEIARRYVRFAGAAARNAARAPRSASPATVTRGALTAAARAHAPGMLRPPGQPPSRRGPRRPHRGGPGYYGVFDVSGADQQGGNGDGGDEGEPPEQGRWVRHGRKIVLHGA